MQLFDSFLDNGGTWSLYLHTRFQVQDSDVPHTVESDSELHERIQRYYHPAVNSAFDH